jgi:hypothetical protein
LRDNPNIKHYDASVALFSSEGTIDELKYVYTALKNVCSEASKDVKIEFEIVQDQQELRLYLKNQLQKLVHGDTMAQFATLP